MNIKVSVTQITHGKEYEGTIEGLNGEIIKYKLSFGVLINELDNQKKPDDPKEAIVFAKKMFDFTITKKESLLEISNELFGFLVRTAGTTAILFYNDSQTESMNEGDGLISDALRNKDSSVLGMFGSSVSIGSTSTFTVPDEHVPDILK